MIITGDCLIELKKLEDNSVDSIVTDPPYGLKFMGKKWDYDVPQKEMWLEALRVLKPGGYLLSFGGTRTYHRMAVAIEDAGFEIRDMISWIYGSGFPKSLNIGKAVDKLGGRCLGKEVGDLIKKKRIELGYSTIQLAEIGGFYGNTNHGGTVSNWETGNGSITPEQFNKLIEILKLEDESIIANERELLGKYETDMGGLGGERLGVSGGEITKGTSEWEGWGTALKPALEPICVARKPLSEPTVALNCLKWNVGGINIDGSRVGSPVNTIRPVGKSLIGTFQLASETSGRNDVGRFPANIIHDGSVEVLELFPINKNGGQNATSRTGKLRGGVTWGGREVGEPTKHAGEIGSASRFFYCAKSSKSERNTNGAKNIHPTCKPTTLMKYLIKLVTPPNGVVLDPFAGSGSTLVAAKELGYDFIGIEREPEYVEIIKARLK